MNEIFEQNITNLLTADRFVDIRNFIPRTRADYLAYVQAVYNLKLSTGFPSTVHIEPTNYCNQSCYMCVHPSSEREKKNIDEYIAIKAIDECAAIGVYAIHFFFFGEPFLNKKTIEYMRYAKEKKIPLVSTTTNFTVINDEEIFKLVDYKIDSVHISFEGLNRERYCQIRGTDHYDTVTKNLNKLIAYKEEKRSEKPWIALTYVRTTETDSEIDEYKNTWQDIVNDIHVSPQFYYFGRAKIAKEKYSINSGNIMRRNEEHRVPCRQLWLRLVLLSNGNLVPCSQNVDGELSIGNYEEISIADAWTGEKMAKLRMQHLSGLFNNDCICKDCIDWDWSGKFDNRPILLKPKRE
ncbi:MAG: radical SAM/SPASM domain-containing protein [Clostridia bacterium]|nr:radical SAM/SPASM domain-containing protein [Clostridia bacterium]